MDQKFNKQEPYLQAAGDQMNGTIPLWRKELALLSQISGSRV
ncbi:MAG TPA: hypothetical protein VK907_05660 [Phnomibacter sp.]|nr:hypothetical protein [Phnomibacter sp.]